MGQQPYAINAYLEGDTTILLKLSDSIILPCSTGNILVVDHTLDIPIPVQSVDIYHLCHPIVVGDFQHLFGNGGDWNTTDPLTYMQEIHRNLYQLSIFLPAGVYQYKVTFDDAWDGAFPAMDLVLNVPYGGARITFSYVPFDLSSQQPQLWDSLNHPQALLPLSSAGLSTDLLDIQLERTPNITHDIQITFKEDPGCPVIPRTILDASRYYYTGSDLGAVFSPTSTSFRVWAPTASNVQLLLFKDCTGPSVQGITLQNDICGTWCCQVDQPLENWYYLYQVTVHGTIQVAVDPYAQALAPNATHAMIVDMTKTNPIDWHEDQSPVIDNPVDAVIYEVHVRDFSISETSGMHNKGKYLAFTERNTYGPAGVHTGVESLLQLGITHVQLLPVFDFASIDDHNADQYNWGYDPRTYNVPDGAYATDPLGSARISEYKQLIYSLHQAGLGVIMDVVYNHTFDVKISAFDKIVPQYYYRTTDDGRYSNGSGVGNELATERPMVRKFVCDSVCYWMREYHVDGFRFDLMALLGVDTMRQVSTAVHRLNPALLLYGEPWTGGTSTLPASQLLTKGQQKNLGLGVFNDDIRNALIGSVFDHTVAGFVSGSLDHIEVMKTSVAGSGNSFALFPDETINYVSCHDNLTLWDKLAASNPFASEADRILMDMLAQAIVLTSQGVPFIHGGEEFLRTKNGNDNSYRSGDGINQFDWSRKARYLDVFEYYAGLIQLRRSHPAFRMTSFNEIYSSLQFLSSPAGTIVFQLCHSQDNWHSILVIYNTNKNGVMITLPPDIWSVACAQGKFYERGVQSFQQIVSVPRISCTILYQE